MWLLNQHSCLYFRPSHNQYWNTGILSFTPSSATKPELRNMKSCIGQPYDLHLTSPNRLKMNYLNKF